MVHLPRTARYIMLGVVAVTPVVFVRAFVDPFNGPKLGVISLATTLALCALLADSGGASRPWSLRSDPILLPTGVLTGALALAWLASPYRGWAIWGQHQRLQGLVPYLIVIAFGVILARVMVGHTLALAWAFSSGGSVVGGYQIIQMLGLDPLAWSAATPYVGSTIGHYNFTGGFLAITLPVAVYLWVEAPRRRWLGAAMTVLTATGCLLSNSQGGWVAAAAGLAVLLGVMSRKRIGAAVGLAVAALLGLTVVVAVGASLLGAAPSGAGSTIESRGYLWQSAASMWLEAPVVGHGPNVYALLGPAHRSLNSVLMEPGVPDDPHSVPLAILANLGLVGFAAFLVVATWAVLGLLRQRGVTAGSAFGAAAVAYLIQSLATVDEPVLRFGFVVALAGVASSLSTLPAETEPKAARISVAPVGSVVAVAIMVAMAAWCILRLSADAEAHQMRRAIEDRRLGDARVHFSRAVTQGDDPYYRSLFARALGNAALSAGTDDGADLIEEMKQVMAPVERLPQATPFFLQGEILHHWGHFAGQGADLEALQLFRRGLRSDPNNVDARIHIAEILLDLGRTADARGELEPLSDAMTGRMPSYWGTLALTRAIDAEVPAALEALSETDRLRPDCRVLIAHQMIKVLDDAHPTQAELLNLRINCTEAQYFFFLDRLPPSALPRYSGS